MKKTAKTAAKTATTKPEAKKCCAKKCAAKKCETKKPALKSVTFTVHAEAGQDVRLAGSFTDWETKAKKMTFKKTNGVYSATVKLAPGEYQYKFIIGDKWTTDDQNAEFVPNDKGTFNSKLVIK
ncbi:MAG: glycogen-binding domain-containing protein [Kiritimatiellae bacterium]|jgi:1,4-alpha-glucan branching enzyme|nr:glycogen-binding domain-containing protein [Kiritimatiellia bacterium]MBR3924750.1 glycogen-binding domain-containing protein [Kiritimatiellia bacterium]